MPVLKVIEVVGISADGWEAAARAAVVQASRTVRHVESVEVVRSTGVVRAGEIVEYHVLVKLTFRVEDDEEPVLAVEAAETIIAEPLAGDGEETPPLLERQLGEALEQLDPDAPP